MQIANQTFQAISFSNPTITKALCMLAVDILLYGSCSFYFANIYPGEYGRAASPLFFLERSYWSSARYNSIIDLEIPTAEESSDYIEKTDRSALDSPDAFGVVTAINLRKVYKTGGGWFGSAKKEVVAVDSINLHLHKGEIFGLIGHNASGKTSTVNMLCGLIKPTSGSVRIKIDNSFLDTSDPLSVQRFRANLGVCHQHDILFDALSPREHVRLFCALKGTCVEFGDLEMYIEGLLDDVSLVHKIDARVSTLSGGQKRALSIALSIIGNPGILLLDEPTTGIDVKLTDHMWRLLEEIKRDRVVLLTTHNMQEADILASRIGIVSKGKIQALGSSLFLKGRYSTGYEVVFDMVANESKRTVVKELVSQYFDEPKCQVRAEGLVFSLRATTSLPKFFKALNEAIVNGEWDFIDNVGVTATTLESVFLQIEE